MPFQVHERVWERGGPPPYGPGPHQVAAPNPWQPKATYGLLLAMVVVYILEMVVGMASPGFERIFVVSRAWPRYPWTLVTSTLSHASPFHLLFNALALYTFGPPIEKLVGKARYLILFFGAGAVAGIIQVELGMYLHGTSNGALGASGAIFALLGVSMVLMPKRKVILMFAPVPLLMVGIIFAVLDLLGLFDPFDSVAHFAHLAGLAAGLAYGWWLMQDLKRRGLRLVY